MISLKIGSLRIGTERVLDFEISAPTLTDIENVFNLCKNASTLSACKSSIEPSAIEQEAQDSRDCNEAIENNYVEEIPPTEFLETEEELNPLPPETISEDETAAIFQKRSKTVITPVPVTKFINNVEIDAAGLPWDARIHSRIRSKTQDMRWRYKRGIDEKIVHEVETELHNLMSIPSKNPIPLPPTATHVAPLPVETGGNLTFFDLMQKINIAVLTNKLLRSSVPEIIKTAGIESLALLPNRPDLIPVVDAAITAEIEKRGIA